MKKSHVHSPPHFVLCVRPVPYKN